MEVEKIFLSRLAISNGEWERREMGFEAAMLLLVTQYGDKLWYIDVDGVADRELLDWFSRSEDIKITMHAVSDKGEQLAGDGYLHPNAPHGAAAIRGAGELHR